MASIVKIKRSSVQGKAPTTDNLQVGELALNTRDSKLFSSDGSRVFEVGSNLHSIFVGSGGLTIGNGAISFPTSDGSDGQYLGTDGNGNLTFNTFDSDSIGFVRGTLTSFPSGDLGENENFVGENSETQIDPFGVPIQSIYDCMDPNGRFIVENLGTEEAFVGA